MGQRKFNLLDLTYQRPGFNAVDFFTKIAAEAFFQIFGFTNIDHCAGGVYHPINTGLLWYGRQKGFGVKHGYFGY